jgi:hypothetical protein
VLELLVALGVEEPAVGVKDGEGGNASGDGNFIFSGDVHVLVDGAVADADVDEDEVLVEELGVGALMVVDVEDLAVAAPVAAEVEEDAFVLAGGAGDGDGDVGRGVGGVGVEVGIGLEEAGLGVKIMGRRRDEEGQQSRCDGKEAGTGARRHCLNLPEGRPVNGGPYR